MDCFGIGSGIKGAAMVYMQAARQTGRTTFLIESVKDGDRIFFSDRKEADRVRRLCLDRGANVECVVIDPKQPERALERGTPNGLAIFDHLWVEKYYLNAIERAAAEIDRLQQQASGYGKPHLETRKQAEELKKWRPTF